jgi:hypothetical protein
LSLSDRFDAGSIDDDSSQHAGNVIGLSPTCIARIARLSGLVSLSELVDLPKSASIIKSQAQLMQCAYECVEEGAHCSGFRHQKPFRHSLPRPMHGSAVRNPLTAASTRIRLHEFKNKYAVKKEEKCTNAVTRKHPVRSGPLTRPQLPLLFVCT